MERQVEPCSPWSCYQSTPIVLFWGGGAYHAGAHFRMIPSMSLFIGTNKRRTHFHKHADVWAETHKSNSTFLHGSPLLPAAVDPKLEQRTNPRKGPRYKSFAPSYIGFLVWRFVLSLVQGFILGVVQLEFSSSLLIFLSTPSSTSSGFHSRFYTSKPALLKQQHAFHHSHSFDTGPKSPAIINLSLFLGALGRLGQFTRAPQPPKFKFVVCVQLSG